MERWFWIMANNTRLYLETCCLPLCWKMLLFLTNTQPAVSTSQENTCTPRERLVQLHLDKLYEINTINKLIAQTLTYESTMAGFALGNTTDTVAIMCSTNIVKYCKGLLTQICKLLMGSAVSASLHFLCSVAISQNVFYMSDGFSLNYCPEAGRKKKCPST